MTPLKSDNFWWKAKMFLKRLEKSVAYRSVFTFLSKMEFSPQRHGGHRESPFLFVPGFSRGKQKTFRLPGRQGRRVLSNRHLPIGQKISPGVAVLRDLCGSVVNLVLNGYDFFLEIFNVPFFSSRGEFAISAGFVNWSLVFFKSRPMELYVRAAYSEQNSFSCFRRRSLLSRSL